MQESPADIAHRRGSPPPRPWVLAQTWRDLLLAHWPVPAAALRARIPAPLALDTFDGDAWIALVAFRSTAIHVRGLPAVAGLSGFAELDVRTCVRLGDRRGVWFLGLDAGHAVAVEVARRMLHLPCFRAAVSCEPGQPVHPPDPLGRTPVSGSIRFASVRRDRRAPAASFRARYGPAGLPFRAAPGSLEQFLTERPCFYTVDAHGHVLRGDVQHAPWPLQPAWWQLEVEDVLAVHGIRPGDRPPLLHHVARLDIRTSWPRRVA